MAARKDSRKTCFVIGPIGEEGSEGRKRADQVIRHVIEPAVSAYGYTDVRRADQFGKPGIISNQIVTEIINADLAVADLTGHNPNVFYELGVRHAFKKHVLLLYERKAAIPFDVAGVRAIALDITDPDSIQQARKELTEQVDAIQKGLTPESPVSVATEILSMAKSNKPVDQAIANLSRMVEDLRAEVRDSSRLSLFGTPKPSSGVFFRPQESSIITASSFFGITCALCGKEVPGHLAHLIPPRCVEHASIP